MSLTQVILVIGFVAAAALAWGIVVWTQHTQSSDIAEIKTTVSSQNADQDKKRDQLGKDFLASQDKIVDKVSTLHDALVEQQATTKQMSDTLTTISNELREVPLKPAATK
jgi:uncharacterized coiled-coil protein SlyX